VRNQACAILNLNPCGASTLAATFVGVDDAPCATAAAVAARFRPKRWMRAQQTSMPQTCGESRGQEHGCRRGGLLDGWMSKAWGHEQALSSSSRRQFIEPVFVDRTCSSRLQCAILKRHMGIHLRGMDNDSAFLESRGLDITLKNVNETDLSRHIDEVFGPHRALSSRLMAKLCVHGPWGRRYPYGRSCGSSAKVSLHAMGGWLGVGVGRAGGGGGFDGMETTGKELGRWQKGRSSFCALGGIKARYGYARRGGYRRIWVSVSPVAVTIFLCILTPPSPSRDQIVFTCRIDARHTTRNAAGFCRVGCRTNLSGYGNIASTGSTDSIRTLF
jgi:hypothetical protein